MTIQERCEAFQSQTGCGIGGHGPDFYDGEDLTNLLCICAVAEAVRVETVEECARMIEGLACVSAVEEVGGAGYVTCHEDCMRAVGIAWRIRALATKGQNDADKT